MLELKDIYGGYGKITILNDFEAQVYYALTLQSSAAKADVTYANQKKSTSMLEDLYTKQPQHPGITHYLIHGYDFAPFADQGIPAARRYSSKPSSSVANMPRRVLPGLGNCEPRPKLPNTS